MSFDDDFSMNDVIEQYKFYALL